MKAVSRAMTKLLALPVWKHSTVRSGPFIALGLLVIAGAAMGATWQVTFDPGNTVDRIGSVVAQTSDGDTVLVGPGTYYEHIVFPDKSLTLLSTGGPTVTTLDGGQWITGRQGSIIYAITSHVPVLTLRGFRLSHGEGAYLAGLGNVGGAIAFVGSTLRISDCVFEENDTGGSGYGGALGLSVTTAEITDCVFRHNRAYTMGQGGHVWVINGRYSFTRCAFEIRDDAYEDGAGIFAERGTGALRLEECTVVGVSNQRRIVSIVSYASTSELIRSRFIDDGEPTATAIVLGWNGIHTGFLYTASVRENLFVGRSGSQGLPSLSIDYLDARATVENNTFVQTKVDMEVTQGPELHFDRNILSESDASVYYGYGGTVECNDTWPDSARLAVSGFGIEAERNISADPLFCGVAIWDFRISVYSPCAPEFSPAGCELIGALGVGCQPPTAVAPVTWGMVKALFR